MLWRNTNEAASWVGEGIGDYGHIRHREDLDGVANSGIPLMAVFDTGEKQVSARLGKHWRIPALESIAYPKNENMYFVRMPDGRDITFVRGSDGVFGAEHFRGWSASKTKDTFHVKSRHGVELVFKNGRLRKFRHPNDAFSTFHYENGRVVEISRAGTRQFHAEHKPNLLIFHTRHKQGKMIRHELSLARMEEDGKHLVRLSGICRNGVLRKTFVYKNETPGTARMELKAQPVIFEELMEKYRKNNPDDFDDEIAAKIPALDRIFSWDIKTGHAKLWRIG
ncbi:MAG: hypothetical protein LBG65_04435 [Puniceicoccales bacterium]|jgi:hypothetical protein|nr:hypothetical protein [Puniceicoccales bacterium]